MPELTELLQKYSDTHSVGPNRPNYRVHIHIEKI